METNESPLDSPEPRVNDPESLIPVSAPIGLAAFSCLALFGLMYWVARPVVAKIGIGWVEFLAYALLPLAVTFIQLYRSAWHREMAVVKRTGYLVLPRA